MHSVSNWFFIVAILFSNLGNIVLFLLKEFKYFFFWLLLLLLLSFIIFFFSLFISFILLFWLQMFFCGEIFLTELGLGVLNFFWFSIIINFVLFLILLWLLSLINFFLFLLSIFLLNLFFSLFFSGFIGLVWFILYFNEIKDEFNGEWFNLSLWLSFLEYILLFE